MDFSLLEVSFNGHYFQTFIRKWQLRCCLFELFLRMQPMKNGHSNPMLTLRPHPKDRPPQRDHLVDAGIGAVEQTGQAIESHIRERLGQLSAKLGVRLGQGARDHG